MVVGDLLISRTPSEARIYCICWRIFGKNVESTMLPPHDKRNRFFNCCYQAITPTMGAAARFWAYYGLTGN
jgi:hypothetical protein